MSKSTPKTYKVTTWFSFARMIKARDADKSGWCLCCTCGKKMRWDSPECQAGHFVAGRGNAVLFDDRIVHSQCAFCNMRGGEQFLYGLFLKKKYGYTEEILSELQNLKHEIRKIKLWELKELKQGFDEEFEVYKKEKDL